MTDLRVYAHYHHSNSVVSSTTAYTFQGMKQMSKTKKIAFKRCIDKNGLQTKGELAQMVERSIRIREARGSIPRFSSWIFLQCQPQGKEFSLIHLEIEVSVARHTGIDLVAKENEWLDIMKITSSGNMPPTWEVRQPSGELAQMVERSLSMREVRGSMPRFSTPDFQKCTHFVETQ